MTTVNSITILFDREDDRMQNAKKHTQANLRPSEVVTNALLFSLKGGGGGGGGDGVNNEQETLLHILIILILLFTVPACTPEIPATETQEPPITEAPGTFSL